jgi:hypothetical protein
MRASEFIVNSESLDIELIERAPNIRDPITPRDVKQPAKQNQPDAIKKSRRNFLGNLATSGALAGLSTAGLGVKSLLNKRDGAPVAEPAISGTISQQPSKQSPADIKQRLSRGDARSAEFMQKLKQISAELRVQPIDLYKVMHFETKGTLNPAITNKLGAVGLIQFMPRTAEYLGTTTSELASLSAVQQLDWVLKYYKAQRLPPGSKASDIYLATLFPVALSKKLPDDHIMAVNPDAKDRSLAKAANERIVDISKITRGRMWQTNPVFKQSGRDYYTVGDVRNTLDSRSISVK